MILSKTKAVREFHKAFAISYSENPNASLPPEKIKLRYDLLKEENEEYLQAAQDGDLVEIADALGDMLYILCGTMIEHGLHDKMDAIFDEIHRSNMSKLGQDGKPIYREDGKVLKGPSYFKPNILKILEE